MGSGHTRPLPIFAMFGTTIKYKGYVLKSRVEFAWAQFFEGEELDWAYEPVRFTEGRQSYTPDFRLEGEIFIETKAYGARNVDNHFHLCRAPLLLIYGSPDRYYIRFKPAQAERFAIGHIKAWSLAYRQALSYSHSSRPHGL